MNGQQLTNSSNSANGTPSSSYPASLSSQSSRDPSPAMGPGAPRKPYIEPYNHILNAQTNHWTGDKGAERHETPLQPHLEKQETKSMHPQPIPQPLNQAPSSQPTHRFPPPTSLAQPPSAVSQNNHISSSRFSAPSRPAYPNLQPSEPPQPKQSPLQSTASQFHKYTPVQSSEPTRSTQSPLQHPNQFQPSSFQPPPSSVSNTLPKSSPVPFQMQPNLPKLPPQLLKQSQPSGHVSHPPNQIPQPNESYQPSQMPRPQPHSYTPQPQRLPQTTQLPSSVAQPQVSQPLSQIPQNMFTQPPIQNAFSQPPKMTLGQNEIQSHTNFSLSAKLNQPLNQVPHSQSAFPLQASNAFAQPPRPIQPQTLPPQNILAQGQAAPHNQYGHVPNQFHGAPTQTAPPPSQYAPMGQSPNHYPQQHSQQFGAPHQNYQQQANNQFNKRYPQMTQQGGIDGLTPMMNSMSVKQGFNALWGMDTVDLLQCRDLLPGEKIEPPSIRLPQELYNSVNCSPEIFRATLTKIPETKSLLDKSRLPLGVLIHPFKDLNGDLEEAEGADIIEQTQSWRTSKQLSVIQCTVIVRCRMCRTYINPFVFFVDNKRWKCNLCFRVNELPDEFQFDPMSKTYGDPSRRPEIKSATIEFIAPSEYMVRPPQPAVYVFALDVSRLACESGYLSVVCRTLIAELDNIPGDARTSVAFITYDSAVHFYALTDGQAQPHQMIVVDIDDVFLPTPDNLLVSLSECRDLVHDLLTQLPNKYHESYDTHSAMGAALQAAYKMLAPTGGRVTVFQTCLPNTGPGGLSAREDPAQRAGDNPPHLNPATDFYKKLALDCSGQQIAVDLFVLNSQYVDLATLSGVSRFSGGCIHHVPLFRADKPLLVESLERMFQRYLTRKIGFESVMRLRCTRGLAIHTFHGNFFVRSTDLLSLPNANPDAGFGMQVTIEDNLTEVHNVCFQAALLYTSSKGERRIRVHTLCLPVASNLADILHGADQQCIAGLLAKMAVDRAVQSSLPDAREAFLNVVADVLAAYRLTQSTGSAGGCLLAPSSLRLLPLYILALLKHMAYRVGQSTRLDDRVMAMCHMKSLPLTFLMQSIYPDLYPLLNIEQQPELEAVEEVVHMPPRLQLSAERIDSLGMFLMDDGVTLMIYVGHNLDPAVCRDIFNVPHFSAIPNELYSLPVLENPTSEALRNFINYLQIEKPYPLPLEIIRDDSHHRIKFLERLVEDKNESGTSYHEFLQRVKAMMKN